MKSTKQIYQALIVILLAHFPLYAQYTGGIADGSSLETITNTTCSTPAHFYAFFGGSGDGESVHTLINATCGTTPGQYAYIGGSGDGASVQTITNTTCGLPPGAYAYTGGSGDGQSVNTLMNQVCPFPPHFYAYFGGSGDGSSMEKLRNCAIIMPQADFTASATSVCVNTNITLTDTSIDAVGWEWTITGGTFVTPSTMYSQNPVIRYATAGTYTVTLKARNHDGDDLETKTAYITVNATASVTATSPASRCGAGSVTISATPSSGTIRWYNAATGGTLLFTGNSFTTPSISTSTTYYAEAFNGCTSPTRTAVVATINTVPTITGNPASRCDAGTVTISANPSAGTVTWHDAPTGGSLLSTGAVYTTPSISTTTTYYAETTSAQGCVSSRIPVVATVNITPTITGISNGSSCGGALTTISATPSAGTIYWYYNPTGGSAFASGNSISVSGGSATFYAEAIDNSCPSPRTAVTFTHIPVPSLVSTSPGQICNSGSTTIGATFDFGTVSWYDAPSGGTLLGTGSTYTTPVISTSTIYYAEAVNSGCASPRQGVYANVNIVNPPLANANQTFCNGEQLNNILITSGSNIVWYDAATGGNVLPSTTTIVDGQTYYATQTISSCESSTTAITMTLGGCLGNDTFEFVGLKMYPNPTQDVLNIEYQEPIHKVEVVNLLGQTLINKNLNTASSQLDLSNYPTGTYLVKVYIDEKRNKVYKVIKQ